MKDKSLICRHSAVLLLFWLDLERIFIKMQIVQLQQCSLIKCKERHLVLIEVKCNQDRIDFIFRSCKHCSFWLLKIHKITEMPTLFFKWIQGKEKTAYMPYTYIMEIMLA